MKTTKKPYKPRRKKTDEVSVSLRLGSETYDAVASTVSEALASIRPPKVTLRGIFTISGNGIYYQTQMFPQQVKRLLFGSDTVRSLFEKNALINKRYI